MKKLFALAGLLGIIALTGCTVASADGKKPGEISVVDVDVKEGYYLSNNDDSYIHVEDGKIELCDYDIEEKARADWEKTDGEKASLDKWIENAVEINEPLFAWKEYTPISIAKAGESGDDMILLVVDYEFASEKGAYTGYVLNDNGTISREGNIYTYTEEAR